MHCTRRTSPTSRLSARYRSGFTLIEMVLVMVLVGILTAMVLPRLRPSASQTVHSSATQLAYDLELARTRAISTGHAVRVTFDVPSSAYVGYLDTDGDGVITQTNAERDSLHGSPPRTLVASVGFGHGAAPSLPGDSTGTAITLPSGRLDLDGRGLPTPAGTHGVVYMLSRVDTRAAAAVVVSGAGAFRVRTFLNGAWK